jgi:hypothetical protein
MPEPSLLPKTALHAPLPEGIDGVTVDGDLLVIRGRSVSDRFWVGSTTAKR